MFYYVLECFRMFYNVEVNCIEFNKESITERCNLSGNTPFHRTPN